MTEKDFIRFAVAGDAKFTAKSRRTGFYFKFRIYQLPKEKCTTAWQPWFVYHIRGKEEIFIGTIKSAGGICWWSRKSEYRYGSDVVKAFIWLWSHRFKGWNNSLEIIPHKCSRCGRNLTNDKSTQIGLGPVCAKKIKEET